LGTRDFWGAWDFWEHGIFGNTGFLGTRDFWGARDFGEHGIFGNTGFLGAWDFWEHGIWAKGFELKGSTITELSIVY